MAEPTPLDARLTTLSEWDGPPTTLWRAALEQSPRRPSRAFLTRPAVRVAALFMLLATVVGAAIPALTPDRRYPASTPRQLSSADRFTSRSAPAESMLSIAAQRDEELQTALYDDAYADPTMSRMGFFPEFPRVSPAIIRDAAMELRVQDVRHAFALAPSVLDIALGEFVSTSSISGSNANTSASLTLRVRSERLDQAMQELRDLGGVVSESSKSRDVSDQLIDTEARLRNAKRVEEELLQLLDSRADAPLTEILELQRALARTREQVERIAAQREALTANASFATIRLTIKAHETEAPSPDANESYFWSQISDAWRSGVRALVIGIALLIRGLVGGLLVWITLAIAIAAIYHTRAKRSAKAEAAALTAPIQSAPPFSG